MKRHLDNEERTGAKRQRLETPTDLVVYELTKQSVTNLFAKDVKDSFPRALLSGHWFTGMWPCRCSSCQKESRPSDAIQRYILYAQSPFTHKVEEIFIRCTDKAMGFAYRIPGFIGPVAALASWTPSSHSDTDLEYPDPRVVIPADKIIGILICETVRALAVIFWDKKNTKEDKLVNMRVMRWQHDTTAKFYLDTYLFHRIPVLYDAGPRHHIFKL
jgi:hypothetical protein